ncbi:MAG: hypothetical protein K6A90_09155 [Lachnospiraceae bacterium]|nr:hypothetical protein [Lachnospiraceae bacterium]
MRVTRKMMNSNSVYNINNNKSRLDQLNTQMATQKKYTDPSDDPITAVRSLRFRSSLSEVSQYLDRNASDAVSWTESTASAIDTAKELMRDLKAEYTSAANGTNEIKDKKIYYENMVHLVNEYFDVGNTASEDRYLFTGYRTEHTLTFTAEDFEKRDDAMTGAKFAYKDITEHFEASDIETYEFTARKGKSSTDGASGITGDEITNVKSATVDNIVNETDVINVDNAYRMRLSYRNIDDLKSGGKYEITITDYKGNPIADDPLNPDPYFQNPIEIDENMCITKDYEIDQSALEGNTPCYYLNTDNGNLIFNKAAQERLSKYFSKGYDISIKYDKENWEIGDAKPEYYFDCVDKGLDGVAGAGSIEYKDHKQEMNYHVGDSQNIKVNTNACDVFLLDARRDLEEIQGFMEAMENAQSKVDKIKSMQADTATYGSEEQVKLEYLLAAAQKELQYASERVDQLFSRGMTKSGQYFDTVNLAATDIGTSSKRLELIKNRLVADKTTVNTQTSNNENVDLSTLAVDVNEASLLYSAALQVTGKISQQSLVNYI